MSKGNKTNNVLHSVSKDRKEEERQYVANKAICRYDVIYNNGKAITLWMVVNPDDERVKILRNIVGDITGTKQNQRTTLERTGAHRTVSRDSKMGYELITTTNGEVAFNNHGGKMVSAKITNNIL